MITNWDLITPDCMRWSRQTLKLLFLTVKFEKCYWTTFYTYIKCTKMKWQRLILTFGNFIGKISASKFNFLRLSASMWTLCQEYVVFLMFCDYFYSDKIVSSLSLISFSTEPHLFKPALHSESAKTNQQTNKKFTWKVLILHIMLWQVYAAG